MSRSGRSCSGRTQAPRVFLRRTRCSSLADCCCAAGCRQGRAAGRTFERPTPRRPRIPTGHRYPHQQQRSRSHRTASCSVWLRTLRGTLPPAARPRCRFRVVASQVAVCVDRRSGMQVPNVGPRDGGYGFTQSTGQSWLRPLVKASQRPAPQLTYGPERRKNLIGKTLMAATGFRASVTRPKAD